MLVLGRKIGESVTLISGRETIATVTVLDNWRGVIRLGWEAPEHITIVRTELLAENKEAKARKTMSNRPLEYCIACPNPTGKAGASEDSIYYLDGGIGPLCEGCHNQLYREVLNDTKLARVLRDLLWFTENPHLHPRDDWLWNQIRAAAGDLLAQAGMKPRTEGDGPLSSEYGDV